MKSLVLLIIFSLNSSLFLQNFPFEEDLKISIEELETFTGEYLGTLKYKDYSTGEYRSLSLEANYTTENNRFYQKHKFTEPDGSIVNRSDFYKIKNGKIGKSALSQKIIENGVSKFVWVNKGRDGNDNKKCTFRNTFMADVNTVTITKEVLFDDETEYFTRNIIELKRK